MFSCLNCRKALIAKSKSHSEISYDGGQFRDEQFSRHDQQQLLKAAGDDLSNDTGLTAEAKGHGGEEDDAGTTFVGGRQVLDGLRRSHTQVRGTLVTHEASVCGQMSSVVGGHLPN